MSTSLARKLIGSEVHSIETGDWYLTDVQGWCRIDHVERWQSGYGRASFISGPTPSGYFSDTVSERTPADRIRFTPRNR